MKNYSTLAVGQFISLVFSLFGLVACGGGGGGTSPNTEVPVTIQGDPSSAYLSAILPPGSQCPAGGVTVASGIDDNANGVLDADEIDLKQVICNGKTGADGANSLIKTTMISAGGICANGGLQMDTGKDTDGDGVLSSNEILKTDTLCNGVNGMNGADGSNGINGMNGVNGSDGINSLIALNPEPAGSNCLNGGTRIDAGGDDNRNNVLDASEIDSTRFLCGAQVPLTADIIYIANPRLPQTNEVFAAATDGSGTTRLFAPIEAVAPLSNFQISPDKKQLAFLLYEDYHSNVTRHRAIYVIDLDTLATARNVSGNDFDVSDYAWSPNSDLLVGIGTTPGAVGNNYFRVFSDGTGLKAFNAAVLSVGDPATVDYWVGRPVFAPDGKHIAMRVQDVDNTLRYALAVVDINTLNYISVTEPLVSVANGNILDFQWARDGSRLAYLGDAISSSPYLYTVAADGTSNQKVSPGFDSVLSFQWSPNSSLIGAVVKINSSSRVIKTVTANGAANFTVSGTFGQGDFKWSPNSNNIAYRADPGVTGAYELYAVSSVGVGDHKVSGTMVSGGVVFDYAWAPDSSRIAFRADREINSLNELYTVVPNPLTTPVPVKVSDTAVVSPPLFSPRGVIDYRWAPDSSRIAIRGDSLNAGVNALSIAAPDASFILDASGSMVAGSDVKAFDWSPDSSKLVFIGDLNTDTTDELFVTDANAGGRTAISTPLPLGSTTGMFLFR